jgi:CheY-like chemotaxis protein
VWNKNGGLTEFGNGGQIVRGMKAFATTDVHSAALPENTVETIDTTPRFQTSLSPHVLVADDDPVFRELNRKILSRNGYEVDVAEDGAVAWDILQFNSYHLLIVENKMPNLLGIELIKKVRIARMALPVMMTTWVSPKEELARNLWLQPAATLLKPYTDAALLGA